MTRTIACSAWSGFVVTTVVALSAGSGGVWAQESRASLPPGVAACDFGALANDHTREGLNIRAEPRVDSAILGRLSMIENDHREKIAADVHVIGVRNGWFLIEGAHYGDYDLPGKLPPVYTGRGWVSGRLLTIQIGMRTLKAAPDDNAADVVEMVDDYGVTAILDCKGDWLRIETPLSTKDYALKPMLPSDGPAGAVRGWTHKSCTNQRTTCGG